ncbi:MAG: hypothetical protein LBF22_00510 [Deltaproteobacteria bacterium]|jgi:hypothetical protein|nr:hypothetical protein [Deltaproteobacteria bacterium]
MLKYLTILITLSVLIFSANVTSAEIIPEYDSRAYCEKKVEKAGGEFKVGSKCRIAEQTAKGNLLYMDDSESLERMVKGCDASLRKRLGEDGVNYVDLENCVVRKIYETVK